MDTINNANQNLYPEKECILFRAMYQNKSLDEFKKLCDGIDFNSDGMIYCTSIAIIENKIDILKYLINSGVPFEKLKRYKLYNLVPDCNTEVIQYLYDSGFNFTPEHLFLSIIYEKLETFKLLYNRMPDVNLTLVWNNCIENASFQIVNYLLDLDIDLDFTNVHLLRRLFLNGKIDIIKKILNRIPNHQSFLRPGCLRLACISGNVELVQLLLDLNFDPDDEVDNIEDLQKFNAPKKIFSTPLVIAISSKKSYDLVKLLLKYGANPTPECLLFSSNKRHVFELIYHSKEWSYTELAETLIQMLEEGVSFTECQFLHDRIEGGLSTEDLKRIIDFCTDTSEDEIFTYFCNFYGKKVVRPLIDHSRCTDDFLQMVKKLES